MSFTASFALAALVATLVAFGVLFKKRGLKSAVIGAGVTLFLSAAAFVAALQLILRNMNN